jgi:septum formation protein
MLVLASASPRRRELLSQAGVGFEVVPSHIPEVRAAGESPVQYVQRSAADKARHVAGLLAERGAPAGPVLAADTEVVLGDEILGKPRDRAHARQMLAQLAGRTHTVLTALCLVYQGRELQALSTSLVTMAPLSGGEIADYVDSGEADDKAGGYAIQGRAALFIERLEGSYSGVMGLPLYDLHELLKRAGVAV